MKLDIKLKEKCRNLAIVFLLLLVAMIVIKIMFFSKEVSSCLLLIVCILVESLIWISSGIGASAITLYITKSFDYKQKRDSAIFQYYIQAKDLFMNILKIEPITLNLSQAAIDSYKNFGPYLEVWKKIKQDITLMYFTDKDMDKKETIDALQGAFDGLLSYVFLTFYPIKDSFIQPSLSSVDNLIFKIEPDYNLNQYIYTSLAYEKIMPLLSNLEELVTNKKTIEEACTTHPIRYYSKI